MRKYSSRLERWSRYDIAQVEGHAAAVARAAAADRAMGKEAPGRASEANRTH
jgi:hypothetical protein